MECKVSWESTKLLVKYILFLRIKSSPKQLDIQCLIVNVSCGDYHTIVLGEDNNIYSCGTNAYDGLGHN